MCKIADMGRKEKFYRVKNAERKKQKQKKVDSSLEVSSESQPSTSCPTTPSPVSEVLSDKVHVADNLTDQVSNWEEPPASSAAIPSSSPPELNRLVQFQRSIKLPTSWSDHSPENLENILVCRISSSKTVPLRITHCLRVAKDLSWSLFINQHQVDVSRCSPLSAFPSAMTVPCFSQLLSDLNRFSVCAGNSDSHFVRMVSAKKGKVVSSSGSIVAYVDEDSSSKTSNH